MQPSLSSLPSSPVDPLDWERVIGPSCCVCGQAYIQAAEVDDEHITGGGGGGGGNGRKHSSPSSRQRGGGGARNGEESYVVLPDSKPVLSEDYFTLARNQHHAAGGVAAAVASSSLAGGARLAGARSQQASGPGIGRSVGGGSSLPPGSELLESGFSAYGGSVAGFGGGWTGSGFGAGSSMLESIVQISHAGLSDNVRRESLLYDMSQRPARRFRAGEQKLPASKDGASAAEVDGGDDERGGRSSQRQRADSEGAEGQEESDDPTLCCHCYASLLEQIDEDSRLADREALAYRDFVEVLSGIIISQDSGLESAGPTAPGRRRKAEGFSAAAAAAHRSPLATTLPGEGSADSMRREGTDRQEHARKEQWRSVSSGTSPASSSALASSPGTVNVQQQQQQQQDGDDDGSAAGPAASPFAQALRMAQETSVLLRRELRSLETQRGALCARGSEAWAALSELAYARGVLGDECRELLQASREVAENAAHLSERSALSELFSIRHVDGFPSINGFRLGRAPDDKRRLHWNEINAAWGEAVLLVRCVSNALDFRSKRFRLVPLNCTSRVIELASGDNSGGLSQEDGAGRRGHGPEPAAAGTSVVVVCAHDLFSTGGGGGRGGGRSGSGEENLRHLAAVRAFLACSAEVMAFLERRVLERRLEGEVSAGAACVAWSDVGVPYKQTEDAVGGVSIGALKGQGSWKPWLCQLVKNLEWAVGAASSLCVA
ncbi:unnamed protein product [Ectocarpus sp. 6 AP-2014]